jgi:phosphoglycerate dehydrogenase-like enzyme
MKRAPTQRSTAKKPRVHFENLTAKPPVFHITAARLRAARRRHADIAGRVTITRGSDLATLPERLASLDVLVTSYDVITHPRFPRARLAQAAPRLAWIFVTSAGIEKLLPLDWLPAGVRLVNASGAHRDKAREFALMSLLMLNAQVPRMTANQRAARWESLFTPSIAGKTVCLVGTGEIGSAYAWAARRLGLRVIGVRRSARPHPGVDRMVPLARLHAALGAADFVVTSAPLTPATAGLFDAAAFAAMRPGAGFINVGRGGVVDHAALVAALRSGQVGNAVLDVYPAEPLPPDSPLWQAPNLVMVPHVAMDDADRFLDRCLDIAFENVGRHLGGRPLRNVVDPVRGY